MATGYGILPMWNFGPSAFGDYTNYMPSMMGLPATGTYGSGSIFNNMYGYGMNPMSMMMEYPIYMQNLQNQLERNNLEHTSFMHNGMINNEVKAHEESLSGVVQKLLTDGAAQEKLMTFYDKLREGDQNGAAQEYDKLKDTIYATYGKELESKGININRADEARRIIETMYADVISASSADGPHTLRADIDRYCGSAFESGFVNGYNNEKGQRYKDELINHIYGERINNYDSKESRKSLGNVLGVTASTLVSATEGAAIGGVAGLGAAGMIYGASRFFSPESGKNFRSKFWNAGTKEIEIKTNKAGQELGRLEGFLTRKRNLGTPIKKTVNVKGWGKRMGKIGLAIGLVIFLGREIFNRTSK